MLKKIIVILGLILTSHPTLADEKPIIGTIYGTIVDKHLTPTEVSELATAGLKVLNQIDKNLTFSAGNEMIYLYYQGQPAGLWHRPTDNHDVWAWAEVTANVMDKATKISPKVARQKENLTETVVYSAVQSLRDHSKYYFSDEADVDDEKSFYAKFDGNFLYLKIRDFGNNTADFVQKSIARYPQTKALILDLRGNHGGQLNAAIEVAKLFIDDGIITATQGKDTNSTKYYIAEPQKVYDFPLAVLIDADTASSAEVLAASLQEQTQALLFGSLSYGKGTIQEIFAFENGGRLALTTGQFFTPSGKHIDKIGVFPDYCIINDKPSQNTACIQQKRAERIFDIGYAKQILASKI